MKIRTPLDLGLTIRDQRKRLGLSQSDLASRVGVGRQWVVAIEHGKASAEIGLVLRALNVLGLSLDAAGGTATPPGPRSDLAPGVDIDAVIADAKRKKR